MDLTVVLPVYNEKELVIPLYRALRSSLDRLVKDYDIIFVDDGSVDGTLTELLRLANSDSHLRIIELTRNFGTAMAIATGREFATCGGVVRLDSGTEETRSDI